jgi:hypothetical protein
MHRKTKKMFTLKQKRTKNGQYARKHKETIKHLIAFCIVVWTVNYIELNNLPDNKIVIYGTGAPLITISNEENGEQSPASYATRPEATSKPDTASSEKTVGAKDDGTVTSSRVASNRNEATENDPIVGKDSVLKKVGFEEGVDWKILKAICLTESGCNSDRIGDGGDSWGAFQINKPSHPTLTREQAYDFEWSARWTARHLKPYANDISLAFKAHNGIGKTTNQWYIDRCLKFYSSIES